MPLLLVLFGSVVALCVGISLVQAYREAKREGRSTVVAVAKRAGVVLVQVWT